VRSVATGLVVGLALGLALSYLAAMTPDPQGKHHYVEIMLPGALLGVIVGFATQRFGASTAEPSKTASALTLLLLLSGTPASSEPPKAPTDPFQDVRFLVGRWIGTSEGQAGQGSVTRTYEPVLNERFLHERNRSEYPAQPSNPKGEVHEHWSVFSHDKVRQTVVLRQFHVEGFVSTYRLMPRKDATASLVFESEQIENLSAGWRARETYDVVSPDEFVETFEVAEPGQAYEVYSRTRLRRQP
jgi:hypothetical protein